jgi:hypothetical protein
LFDQIGEVRQNATGLRRGLCLRKGGGDTQTYSDRKATYKKLARERSIHSHLQYPKFVNKNYNAPQTNESDGALYKLGN